VFNFDDDLFTGYDDAISFDDIWSFDDDYFSFDDDMFSFDDAFSGDDDLFANLMFSVNLKCIVKNSPIMYTPQPSSVPTQAPGASLSPSMMPSLSSPTTVSFQVSQALYGITYDTYQADADSYESVLIDSIAECMTGVTSDNIDSFGVSAGSRRLFSFFQEETSVGSYVLMSYTVTVDSSYDYEGLSNELESNIASGKFDSYLSNNAQGAGTTALITCYSTTASSTQTQTNSVNDDTSSSSSSGGLSDGGIAGVVIAVLLVVVVVGVAAYYYMNVKTISNENENASTASTPAKTVAPSGDAVVSLKDIQLTTAPVFGIATITNAAEANNVSGNAEAVHDNI